MPEDQQRAARRRRDVERAHVDGADHFRADAAHEQTQRGQLTAVRFEQAPRAIGARARLIVRGVDDEIERRRLAGLEFAAVLGHRSAAPGLPCRCAPRSSPRPAVIVTVVDLGAVLFEEAHQVRRVLDARHRQAQRLVLAFHRRASRRAKSSGRRSTGASSTPNRNAERITRRSRRFSSISLTKTMRTARVMRPRLHPPRARTPLPGPPRRWPRGSLRAYRARRRDRAR